MKNLGLISINEDSVHFLKDEQGLTMFDFRSICTSIFKNRCSLFDIHFFFRFFFQILISIILALVLTSCGATKGLRTEDKRVVQRSELYPVIDTQGEKKEAWFNISIQFYKNENSGQLLVKQTSDSVTRVLFTTPFGFKIFDFAISPHDFKVLSCIDPLKKKKTLRIFEKDFRLMFCPYTGHDALKIYYSKNDTAIVVYKLKNSGTSYYWINRQKKTLYKIDNRSFPIGGARIYFDYTGGNKFPKIILKQKGIKLRFELEPFVR
jgi:hypothetical protein